MSIERAQGNAASRPRAERLVAGGLMGAAVAAFVAFCVARLVAVTGGRFLSIDDAYYYVVTARNFVETGTFTFDGVNATNGFHPLWMAVCVALVAVFDAGDGTIAGLRPFALAELALLIAAGAAVLVAAGRALLGPRRDMALAMGCLAALLAIVFPSTGWRFALGLETALSALLTVLTLLLARAGALGWLSGVMALLVLSRLDTALFVVAPTLIYVLWRRGLLAAVLTGLPAVLATLAAMAVNQAYFGHATPISGALKSSFPVPRIDLSFAFDSVLPILRAPSLFGLRQLLTNGNLAIVTALTLGSAVLAAAIPRRRLEAHDLHVLVVTFALVFNLYAFQVWAKTTPAWYLALPVLTAYVAAARLVWKACDEWGAGLAPIGLLAAMLIWSVPLNAPALAGEPRTALGGWRDDFYACLRERTDPGDLLAGTDVGEIAYHARRNVVNLDGLINNYDYQAYLSDGRLADYVADTGITHLVVSFWEAPQANKLRGVEPMYRHRIQPAAVASTDYGRVDFFVHSYLHGRDSEPITLAAEQELCRTPIFGDGTTQAVNVLFALPRP